MLNRMARIGRRAIAAIGARWRDWRARRQQMHELAGGDEYMAREFGFTPGDLRLLVDCGAGSADFLRRRLDTLGLDAERIKATEPDAMWDMQRCCSLCQAKRRCTRDLDAADNSGWRDYCVNAQTLGTLQSDKTH